MGRSSRKLHSEVRVGKMKSAIVLVVCVSFILGASAGGMKLPQEIIDLLKNLSETCVGETGVSRNFVDEFRQAKLPDDPKAKCYLKCMMMQLQAMKEDGSLDTDLIEASMPDILKAHGGMETVHKCKDTHDPDLCETAYQLMVCFKKENPELAAMFE